MFENKMRTKKDVVNKIKELQGKIVTPVELNGDAVLKFKTAKVIIQSQNYELLNSQIELLRWVLGEDNV